ncbi:hypothetical protein PTSG_02406 [Salpingoeca rosetta]|uniref:ribonuclease Z n=1 Tax=Salpingoeca rosetta (strain ATCC 50818 / BSB-021) TaxID=946362 RepID=F2U241_SALR5|nr:uncharacterized protein PTSG_02406 [Salpingoeca rosetta]EGD81693.1 hypothetical protein PTSG_02406 [Salpingoeca rosetta]|eukprot:XP_004996897.1 hypothetical protein PTSG_02406 [Salpingoeca rosetta]
MQAISTWTRACASACAFAGPRFRAVIPLKRLPKTRALIDAPLHSLSSTTASRPSSTFTMSAVSYLQIVAGSCDTGPSAFIFTDDRRYLFNTGEGIQRFCMEHKIRLKQVTDIFFTKSSWECIGGLPGMLLTMQDMYQVSHPVALHAPPHLSTMLEGTKTFMQHRSSLYREFREYTDPVSEFDDGRLRMKIFTIHARDQTPALHPHVISALKQQKYMEQAAPPVSQNIGAEFDHHATHEPHTLPAKKVRLQPKQDQSPGQQQQQQQQQQQPSAGNGHDAARQRTPSPISSRLESASPPPHPAPQLTLVPPTAEETLAAAESTRDTALAYVGSLVNPRPGKFNVQKAKAAGVPKGPLWGQLGKGNEVTLDDGRVVKPEDVLDPVDPLPHFAIVHIPTRAALEATIARSELFDAFRAMPSSMPKVVHFTSQALAQTDAYAQLLQQFGPNVTHVFVDPQHNPHATTISSTKLQYMLQTIGPTPFAMAPVPSTVPELTVPHALPDNCSVVSAQPLYRVFLSKRRDGLLTDATTCLPIVSPEECRETVMALPDMQRLLPQQNEHAQAPPPTTAPPTTTTPAKAPPTTTTTATATASGTGGDSLAALRPDERVLHFMGTGSAVPSQLRNVTGMLLTRGIWVDSDGATTVNKDVAASMLLDCGEGSLSQLQRKFGAEHMPAVLRSLRLVHISHMHADHHLGLTRVLARRREAFAAVGVDDPPPVVVVAPHFLWLFMRYTAHLSCATAVFLDARWTRFAHWQLPRFVPPHVKDAYARAMAGMGLRALATPAVKHCFAAYGLVLDFDDGYRFAWSGDTRPCKSMVGAGKGADVLVHEATFEDGLEDQAVQKNHSTTSDAVTVAQQMGAKMLILTHFSQRYPQIPVLDAKSREHTAFGFDLMSVVLRRAKELTAMTPAIDHMFTALKPEEEEEEGDDDGDIETIGGADGNAKGKGEKKGKDKVKAKVKGNGKGGGVKVDDVARGRKQQKQKQPKESKQTAAVKEVRTDADQQQAS